LAGGGYGQKLLVFVILLSTAYSFMGYAWSAQYPSYSEDLPSGITAGSLLNAGIAFTDSKTYNVSEDGVWVEFPLNDYTYRVRWTGDLFYFQRRMVLITFIFYKLSPSPYNETLVIENYDEANNFTEIQIDEDGSSEATLLFSVTPGYNNITDSINHGNITITIGRSMEQISTGNWWEIAPRAVGWFVSTTLGGWITPISGLSVVISLINTMLLILGVLGILFWVRGV